MQEVAKTTGVAIRAVEKMGAFISNVAGVPIATAVGIFEDKLRYMRWENQLNLINKANEKLAQRGLCSPTGTCQPVSDSYSRINVVSRAVCFAAGSVGKFTADDAPSPTSSDEIGLMATDVGGIGAIGRPRTKRSGFA